MGNNKSKKHRRPNKRVNKSKKRVKGGCGCNNSLFKGGSTDTPSFNSNLSSNYIIPLNQQIGSSNDPLTTANYTNTRLSLQNSTTPNLLGGGSGRKQKRKNSKNKSKKIKGGNLQHNLNSGFDRNVNSMLLNNSLQGLVSLPKPYSLA